MVTKPKDTQHKKYININVYQTNSPPKLVTTKTFFPLTWSSPPKSITPPEDRHSILKFLPLFDTIVKGHKKPKDLTGDRQKTNREGMRRTRNHRPTRKRKTRCYGHKGKNNAKQRKKKCMQGNLNCSRGGETGVEHNRRQQMQLLRICRGTNQQKAKKISIDPPGVEKLLRRRELSRSIHQVSRCWRDCDKKKLRKLDR